jgi:hypothetical protein
MIRVISNSFTALLLGFGRFFNLLNLYIVLYPVLVDTSLRGDRVIGLSSTNGPEFELLTDAVSWAEVNWLSFVLSFCNYRGF